MSVLTAGVLSFRMQWAGWGGGEICALLKPFPDDPLDIQTWRNTGTALTVEERREGLLPIPALEPGSSVS